MSTYHITKTQPDDLDEACNLFRDAIDYQKTKGYPEYRCDDRQIQAKDIAKGQHYKAVLDDEMAAIFSMWYTDEKIWRHHDQGHSIYLHRIVTSQKHKGKGLLKLIINWVNEYAIQNNKSSLRIDTWDNNPDLIAYYEKHGFAFVEQFQIPDTNDMPVNCRGNAVVLLEFTVE